MSFGLEGRIVFITGASRGIGRACAVEYHRAGCSIVATARSLDRLEALAAELGGQRVLPVAMDVTDAGQRQAALRAARERFGRIDVLVNNAGWAAFGPMLTLAGEHAAQMLNLNFAGPLALIQAVLPEMLERRSGQIVNISSVLGNQPTPGKTVYSATKAALSALSTGLRMELHGTGVDVLLISPGSTRTEFFQTVGGAGAESMRRSRWPHSPQQVARAVVRSSRNQRAEVTLTVEGKVITAIRRFSHWLADGIVRRVARSPGRE